MFKILNLFSFYNSLVDGSDLHREAPQPFSSSSNPICYVDDDSSPFKADLSATQVVKGSGQLRASPVTPAYSRLIVTQTKSKGSSILCEDEVDEVVRLVGVGLRRLQSTGMFGDTVIVEAATERLAEIRAAILVRPNLTVTSLDEIRGLLRAENAFEKLFERVGTGMLADGVATLVALCKVDLLAVTPADGAALVSKLYDFLGKVVTCYNDIYAAERTAFLQKEKSSLGQKDDEIDWNSLYRQAGRHLYEQPPEDLATLRDIVFRTCVLITKLKAPLADSYVLELIPHADYAGWDAVAASPKDAFALWLKAAQARIDDNAEFYRRGGDAALAKAGENGLWRGSKRSGGIFQNFLGTRQSVSHYRVGNNPFEQVPSAALGFLAVREDNIEKLAEFILASEKVVAEVATLYREQKIIFELNQAGLEQFKANLKKRHSEEDVDRMINDLIARERASFDNDRHNRLDGLTDLDGFIQILGYSLTSSLPPDDRLKHAHAEATLAVFKILLEKVTTPALYAVVVQAALHFADAAEKEGAVRSDPALLAEVTALGKNLLANVERANAKDERNAADYLWETRERS